MAAQQLNQINEEYAALKQKDTDNSEIMRKLTTELDQIPRLTEQIQDLTESNSKYRNELERLTTLAETKEKVEKENEELKKRERENTAVVQQLMSDIEGLKKGQTPPNQVDNGQSVNQLQELERLRSELEEMHGQQIVMMKEQLREQMNSQIEDLNNKLKATSKENAQLSEQVQELNESVTTMGLQPKVIEDSADPESDLRYQLERLRDDKASWEKELEDLKQKHQEDVLKIQQLNAEIESAGGSADHVSATNENLEEEISKLTQKLANAEQQHNEIEVHNSDLITSKTQLEQKLEEVQKTLGEENNALRMKATEMESVIEKLHKELETLQIASDGTQINEIEKIKAKLEEEHGQQISIMKEQLVNDIQNLTRQLEVFATEKASLESELEGSLRENENMREKEASSTQEYQREIEKLKQDMNEAEKMKDDLAVQLNQQVDQARAEVETLQTRLDELEKKHQEEMASRLKDEYENTTERVQEVRLTMEETYLQKNNSVKEGTKRRIGDLENKIVDLQEEKTKLMKEFLEKEENFEKQKAEMQQQVQQMREWNADATEKQNGDEKLKTSVKQLRGQILQYRSQIVDLGAKLDAAVQERTEMAEAFKKSKVAIRDYEKKNPDLAALRKEIEERDTTIQVMWIENEDLKAEIVKLNGGIPSPSVHRSPGMSPAMSQASISSVCSRSPHMSPAASHAVLTETVTPIKIETYHGASPGDDGHSSLNGSDPDRQELDHLRRKDSENIDIITKLTKELENLRAGSNTGSFVSGEQILSQSQAHEDSPVVFQLKVKQRDLEKQKEDLIHQKRDLEAKLDLEVQTGNEEKKKLTRQVTEWRDWYQTLSVQLADYEQDIKQLKQLKEENTQYNTQIKELTVERDKVTEELKQAKKSLSDFDQKNPNMAQFRKQMEEMRSTLQVHWIENEQLKKQFEDYQGKGTLPSNEEVNELKKELKEAEEQLAVLKQSGSGEADEPSESGVLQPAVNALANMTPADMQEHYKSMNTNLALAVAEKQSLLNKIKELEHKLAEANLTESAAASKPKGKDGRKTSNEEKANLVIENQALQNKILNLETQPKEARKVEHDAKVKLASGKPGRKSGVKEDRLTVPERQTFQNRIKELEMQLKEAKKTAKESSARPRATPKKSSKEDPVAKEEVKDLKAKLQASTEEKESMKSKLKALETQLKIEQIEETALLGRVKEYDAQLESEQSDLSGGAKQSSKQRRKHHKELAAMQRKYDEELKEVRKQLEETRVQYASEVELLQNEHTVTRERLNELERHKEVFSSGSDAESTPRETIEKIQKLKSEFQRVKAERDRLLRNTDCSETTEFELHELKMKIDLLESEKVEMSSVIENLEKEKREAVEAMQQILKEKEELLKPKPLSSGDSDEQPSSEKAKAGHKAVLQVLKAELEQLKADHKLELVSLKTEMEYLRASKATEESPPEGATAPTAEEELEQTKASHQAIVQMLMAELDQLKIDHKGELERIKSDMKRIRKESSELKQLRSVSDEENVAELRARHEGLRTERDILEDKVRAYEVEKDTLEMEGLKLVTEMKQEHKVSELICNECKHFLF